MFSKLFKKPQPPANAVTEPPAEIIAAPSWESRLRAAIGDDAALLALAIGEPSIDHKLDCVRALAGEEGLKAAEREFRKRDRRAHSLAKQRYETLVKQRETRAGAAGLIGAAAALLEAPVIPANRLAELVRAWECLPRELIEDKEISSFAKLQADLAELIRERGERNRAASRWSTAANRALAELNSANAAVAASAAELQELAAACEKARITLAEIPATVSLPAAGDDANAAFGAAIRSALQDAALIEIRLAVLDGLQSCQAAQQEPLSGESDKLAENTQAAIEHWKSTPPMADQRIENALNARFEACLSLRDRARKNLQKQSGPTAIETNKAARQAGIRALTVAADAAEAALAAGQLGEAGKQLAILQAASEKDGAVAALQSRIGALQSEFARLKGWQQWGGGRARDDLVAEAETLAASTIAPEGAPPPKLPVKQIENSIEQLRARWKELDRLGGATSQALWQRFDAALKTAYFPVAAHLAQLNEARQENLAARTKLLDTLDALDIAAGDRQATDWREIQRALSHFQTEWRKLGPVEHTAPRKLQQTLSDRMKAGIARLEEPLKEAQAVARAEREQLIARAKALGQDAQGREVAAKLRELQSQWQSNAKSLPLPRKTENLLWAEFKAATDDIMNRREAAFSAREAGFKANQARREALIAQLEAFHQDTPPADIKRILASVDTEWRKAGEAPRNQAAGLESKYRAAREQAQEYIAGGARRSWQAACDALLAGLALCEELESAASSQQRDGVEARWNIQPALLACWEEALQARYKSGCENPRTENPGNANPADSGEPFDQLLLQLESSLEIPSPAAFQNARQTLKLQAMKNAMEGRRTATPAWPDIEKMIADAIGRAHLEPDQRSRLHSVVMALRDSGMRVMAPG